MKFRYESRTKEGELQAGFVDAGSRDSAVNILSGHNLFILKLEAAEKVHWYDRVSSYWSRVRREDLVIFTRQLATLLQAQLSLNRALATLEEQTTSPTLKEAIRQISQDVDSGLALSQALERQNEIFSGFFISMVRTAEVTGNLDQTAVFLADYTEREAVLISKARSAMIYPSIVIALFVLVAGVMITTVFPQIKPIFDESDVKLPLLSSIFINAGAFLAQWWPLVVLILIILIVMLLDYLRTAEGRALWDDLKIRLPVIRKVYLPVTLTRFADAAAMLSKGGVPVAQAMEVVGETVDNVLYRDILHEISNDVREGMPLSDAVAKHTEYFPPLVSQMIAVGESTGRLDDILLRLAAFYGREADSVVSNIVELIQPILMIVIGVMVALLFASILMPLYRLTAAF
ncbi:MAG: type II secretion system F family protein [Patescibacteria group bacterium]